MAFQWPCPPHRDALGRCPECPHLGRFERNEVCDIKIRDRDGNPLAVKTHACHMESSVTCAGHTLQHKTRSAGGRITYCLDLVMVTQDDPDAHHG